MRDEQRSFVDYCLAAYPYSWTKSPTERIREFDGIRLYVLSLKERELTAAPSDIDRVNVASMNHILAICGGYMKVRFSGEVNALGHYTTVVFHSMIYFYRN